MWGVPMREDCRHFQSRTYDTGEVARFCVLDLAPEAPWRCPAGCSRYQPELIDGTFVVGSMVRPPVEDEPDDPPEDISALLAAADSIVTSAAPEIVREVVAEQGGRRWWRIWKRGKRPDDGGEFHLSER
jgi:hypothetical protein